MNKPFDAAPAYINNITSLWKAASLPFQALHEFPAFSYCAIEGVSWPNKLWFHKDLTEASLQQAFTAVPALIHQLSIPHWDVYGTDSWKILEAKGYVVRSQATGMWMPLQEPFELNGQLQFEPVTNMPAAILWKDIFFQSFNYLIPEDIVMQSRHAIHYYVAFHENQPVGCAMLFMTGKVAGIHSVGVLPAMRRKGFANEIMRFLLNEAIELNSSHAVLHASQMGKDLYLKLGFEEAFAVRNYVLP